MGGDQRIGYLWRRGEHPTQLVARRGVYECRRRAEGYDPLICIRWRPAHGNVGELVGFVRVLPFQFDAEVFQSQVRPPLELLQGQPRARDERRLLEEDLCGSSDAVDVAT